MQTRRLCVEWLVVALLE